MMYCEASIKTFEKRRKKRPGSKSDNIHARTNKAKRESIAIGIHSFRATLGCR